MKIDNAQLHAFATVLREGSFEAAARFLNITAPAVSQRIRQLEDRLGQVLIQRSVPCSPTAAGKTLASYAEQVSLLEAETLHNLVDAGCDDPHVIRIPIALSADSLESWFMVAFEELSRVYSFYLDVRVDDLGYSAAMLRDGSVLAAITADCSPIQGCRVIALGAMRYVAVASRQFVRRYFKDGVDVKSFSSAPMLRFNSKDALQQCFIRKFADNTLSPPTHFIPSSAAFIDASRRSIGWCVLPELVAEQYLKNCELVEISPGMSLDVPLYLQRCRINSRALDIFTQVVRDVAIQLLRQDDLPPANGPCSPRAVAL